MGGGGGRAAFFDFGGIVLLEVDSGERMSVGGCSIGECLFAYVR